MLKELGKVTIKQSYIDLFEQILKDYYQRNLKEDKATVSTLDLEIEKNKTRIASAQQLMLDGELEASDYKQIKSRYETEIAKLQRKKAELSTINVNLLEYVNGALDLLRNLPDYYNKASLPVQQKIIGSIFLGRVVFQNGTYQTKGYNEVIKQIRSLDKGSEGIKTELACENASQSNEVTPPGFKPGTY